MTKKTSNPFKKSVGTYNAKLSEMNAEQMKAINATDGAVLIIAGAGTGKTSTITMRSARLVEEKKVKAQSILLVTFTKLAATEMKERLEQLIGRAGKNIKVGTFHAVGLAQLMERPDIGGWKDKPEIVSENSALINILDQCLIEDWENEGTLAANIKALLPQALKEEGNDGQNNGKTPPAFFQDVGAMILDQIASAKDHGLSPEEYQQWIIMGDPSDIQIVTGMLYPLYQKALQAENKCDFADLMLWPTLAMRTDEALRQKWAGQYEYVTVDEYQDTNTIQAEWLRYMVEGHGNLCCVGDDDQALYQWRGAKVTSILNFDQEYPDAIVVHLKKNYRSSKVIIEAANAMIAVNQVRRSKHLESVGVDGQKIGFQIHDDPKRMMDVVAHRVKAAVDTMKDRGETPLVYILYRSNYLARRIEEAMIRHKLTYDLVKGEGYYGREEVKDCMAFLQLLCAEQAEIESFLRVINKPARGIGEKARDVFESLIRENSSVDPLVTCMEALMQDENTEIISNRAREGFLVFMGQVEDFREDMAEEVPLYDLGERFELFLQECGYIDYWQSKEGDSIASRLENISEFVGHLAELKCAAKLIKLAKEAEKANRPDAPIKLMTMHGSKGLEAPYVFFPFYDEGAIPSKKALEAEANGNGNAIEDERRLAYVGLTRSKLIAEFHCSDAPSRFLYEVPGHLLQEIKYDGIERVDLGGHVEVSDALSEHESKILSILENLKTYLADTSLEEPDFIKALPVGQEIQSLLERSSAGRKAAFKSWGSCTGSISLVMDLMKRLELHERLLSAREKVTEKVA